MKRKSKELKLGDGAIKYLTILESEPCDKDSPLSKLYRQELIAIALDNPHTLDCGPVEFQSLYLFHNGTGWVLEGEATVANAQSTT